MNNLDFFELSKANSILNFDFSNPEGVLVIPKTREETNELIEANNKLIDFITTYKVLKQNNQPIQIQEEIIEQIISIIEKTKFINYSSFCIYFQVLRFSYSSFMSTKTLNKEEKIELIKKTLDLYIDNRHEIYNSHGYSNQVLQVQSDAASSRRHGATGTNSLSEIMEKNNIKRINKLFDFIDKNAYILPDKGDSNLLNEIKVYYDIDFKFQIERDNKNPDLVFKIDDDIFIVEHKLTEGIGGAQNMEINEIISFIGYDESEKNVHYVSCLEGSYLAALNEDNITGKINTQHENIINNLNNNNQNYFVNEFGLEELIKQFKK